jgi:hypothetical protein
MRGTHFFITPTHQHTHEQESGERFCEPLDYIFLSPEWKVNDAIQLQSKEDALKLPCPFPDQVSKGGGGGWEEIRGGVE